MPPVVYDTLSIIVPAYNEAGSIEACYRRLDAVLRAQAAQAEVIIVDDGSTDETYAILKALQVHDASLRLIGLRPHAGKTAALAAGIAAASGDVILCIDGDLQYDPDDIPRLLARIEQGWDAALGWRVARPGEAWLTRRLPSWVANQIITRLCGVRLHDVGTGLQAYRRGVALRLPLSGQLHRFMPIFARALGASVAEVPIIQHPRRAGRSKYGLGRIGPVCVDLTRVPRLMRRLRRQTRQMQRLPGSARTPGSAPEQREAIPYAATPR